MKWTTKQKLFAIIGFFLGFFSPAHFDIWKCLKKFLCGWRVTMVVCLNIVSSSGTGFVKARFGQVGD